MDKIKILAYKMDSYDTDFFIREVGNYSKNSIILVFDFDKIVVHHKPSNVYFKKETMNFVNIKYSKFRRSCSALSFFLTLEMFVKLFSMLCWKHRPEICIIESPYVAVVVGILQKFKLCGKSIYIPGDWLVNGNNKNLSSYIANNLLFPMLDYLSCKLCNIVLNHSKEIENKRYKFWGRKIAKIEKLYLPGREIRRKNTIPKKERNAICFIGNAREDSGIEIPIRLLAEVGKQQGLILKIIGPEVLHLKYLKALSNELGVGNYVEFLGFVEQNELIDKLSDCFCGINLLKNDNNYSTNTTPGKFIYYLQCLLPIITTEAAGAFANEIREYGLGLVIEPSQDVFVQAVNKIYKEQKQYRENIICYLNSCPKNIISEILCSL